MNNPETSSVADTATHENEPEDIFAGAHFPAGFGAGLANRDVVIGAYFSGRVHPQYNVRVNPESLDYVAGWMLSAARLGLTVLLLHDGVSQQFMERCHFFFDSQKKRNGVLHFVHCQLGPYTVADERFLASCAFLERFPCRSVFIVDVSDAWFKKDPARLLRDRSLWNYFDISGCCNARTFRGFLHWLFRQWECWFRRREYNLFMGGEGCLIGSNPWMLKQFQKVYGKCFPHFDDKPVLNCGIVGGEYNTVLALLQQVREELLTLGDVEVLYDMSVFTRCVYDTERYMVYTDGVLNSPWKTWAKSGKHCIFHK